MNIQDRQSTNREQPLTGLQVLKERSRTLEPVMRIGAKGLTQGAIEEIQRQLKRKKLIKIKLLKSFISDKDKNEIPVQIARAADAILVDRMGLVIVLGKRELLSGKRGSK